MPMVPLGMESYSREDAITPATILRNFYLEEDKSGASPDQVLRLQRPGLSELVSFPASIRAVYQMDGVINGTTFVIAGNKLYSTDWTSYTQIGTVANDGKPAVIVANPLRLGIVSGGLFYTYDGTTLAQVDLPDDVAPSDIETLNGFFILPLANGTFYWLTPDQDDFLSAEAVLQYVSAESLPDGLKAVRRVRDDLYLFGTTSIEIWQVTGESNPAYIRASGRTMDRGSHSRDATKAFDNSVFFVGEDGFVYRLTDVPQRVSSAGIEERIAQRSGDCSAMILSIAGHKFYVLTIPSQGTFAYDVATEAWSEFATIGAATWIATGACEARDGVMLCAAGSSLARLDHDTNTDLDEPIERALSATVALPSIRMANSTFALWIGSSEAATVTLKWRDGLDTDWTGERELACRTGSDIVRAWRLGATKGASRTFMVSTTSDAKIRISGAMANEGRAV